MTIGANLLARIADIFSFNQYSNRNLIVDGAKEFWNSGVGTPVNVTAGYSTNALYINAPGTGGTATYAHSQAAAAPGSRLGVPRTGLNFGTWVQTVASTGNVAARTSPQIACRIEDVNTTEGLSLTFSVWLWVNSGTLTVGQVSHIQGFGSGGSPSANVNTLVPVNWVLTTTPKRFSVRLDIPSASGKTLGTTDFGWLQVEIDYPTGSTYTINDGWWQLEVCSPQSSSDINGAGGAPTWFEYRGQAAEWARVARYWQTMNIAGNQAFAVGMINSASGGFAEQAIPGGIMRKIPSVTASNGLGSIQANGVFSSVGIAATSDRTYQTQVNFSSGGVSGQAFLTTANAAGSTIFFDARL